MKAPVAFVTPRAGMTLRTDELAAFVNQQVGKTQASHKPTKWWKVYPAPPSARC